jgi:hypothetical protein
MRPCFFFTSATSDFTAVGGTSVGRDHLGARHILTGCCDSLRIRTGVDHRLSSALNSGSPRLVMSCQIVRPTATSTAVT